MKGRNLRKVKLIAFVQSVVMIGVFVVFCSAVAYLVLHTFEGIVGLNL